MKTLKKFSCLIMALMIAMSLQLSFAAAEISDGESPSISNEKITRDNYNDYVDAMEAELNGDNVIAPDYTDEKTFGTYARLHFDGWNVQVTDYKFDGLQVTLTLQADEGYVLPAALPDRESRPGSGNWIAQVPRLVGSTANDNKYTVDENGIGTLTFRARNEADASSGIVGARLDSQDSYYSVPVLVFAAAVPQGEKESTYLKDYRFANVEHRANYKTGYLGYEHTVKPESFRLTGSRTYLTKQNTDLKIYVRAQENFAPMEVGGYIKTGITDSPDKTDYSNRYIVFNVGRNNVSSKEIFYQPTLFTVNVWDAAQSTWVRVAAYDYYHEDNEIRFAELLGNRFDVEGKKITSLNLQTYQYDQTMSQIQTSKLDSREVGLDYTLSTKKDDFDVQWVNSGTEKVDESDASSLRFRQGDIYVTPRYTDCFTVTFVDYNGNVLKSEEVLAGQDAAAPEDPVRSGYRFTGWDKEFTNVQEDLTVTAQYRSTYIPVTPPTEIEDPDVPLDPNPGEENPDDPGDVDIDEPDVPLAPGIDIDEPDTPKADKPNKTEKKNDNGTAKNISPKTGDDAFLWLAVWMMILAAAGTGCAALIYKRK